MDGNSLNIAEEKLNQLKSLMPEIFDEGKIDWEKLRATLGEEVNFSNERYVLNWAGKSDAFRILQQPSSQTLVPAKEESVDFDNTKNIFIEGENLEVLKVLQKSYFGKVKMIYIDPPYNTGSDSFIYPDKFSESKEEYRQRVGDLVGSDELLVGSDKLLVDSDKCEVDSSNHSPLITNHYSLNTNHLVLAKERWGKNSKENGQYHSNWLNMMMPRLYLAKNLLREDGVIFISIDDNEVHNLRLLMNEIFGEENFIECISWNKRVPKNDKGIGNIHEYILIYVKDNSFAHQFLMRKEGLEDVFDFVKKLKQSKMSIPDSEREIKKYYKKQGYDRGITLYNSLDENYRLWGKINMSWPNANTFGPRYEVLHPITKKAVKIPDRGWRWKKETFDESLDYDNIVSLHDGSYLCGKIWFDKDENTQPSSILYLDDVNDLLLRSILSLKSDGGIEVEKLFDEKSYFSSSKEILYYNQLFTNVWYKYGAIMR